MRLLFLQKHWIFVWLEEVSESRNQLKNARVIAKKREGMRDFVFLISREEFFFNFPFLMKKGKFFWEISLLACEKGNFFFEFPFSHEKKSEKNEFLSTKMSKISDFLWEGKRFFSHFPLREKKNFNFPSLMGEGKFFWGISLPACGKGRDCLFIFLLNDHPEKCGNLNDILMYKV